MLSTVFEHSRIVSRAWKNVRALDCISCSKIFLPAVLKNSTEQAETLFFALIDSRGGGGGGEAACSTVWGIVRWYLTKQRRVNCSNAT